MPKIHLFISALIILTFGNCQYPVDNTTLPDAKQYIVIEAELTESFAKINVAYSLSDLTSKGGFTFPKLPKAVAYIIDGRGTRTDFIKTDGTPTTAFRGIVGETYRLFIEVDGKKYESKPETMAACPELDSVTAPYRQEVFRAPTDLYYDGFDVYAHTKDFAGKENFYQWDWIHYERAAFCDSKYRASEGGTVLLPCNPFDCWNIIYNTRTIALSDKLRDGQNFVNRIVRIPYSTPPNKYYLKVTQRAITPSVFSYLQSLETQTQNTGTLFDIPAQTRFSPNISNVNDPNEQVLGVFSVYSFRQKTIYIDMVTKIDGATVKTFSNNTPFTTDIFLNAPCIEGLYRTKIKPEGWID